MNSFEQFIKENRGKLDTENLDKAVWLQIEKSFRAKKRKLHNLQYGMAAALLALLGIFWLLRDKPQQKTETANLIFTDIQSELQKTEVNYIQLINSNIAEIQKTEIPAEKTILFDNFIEQLHTIDKQLQLIQEQVETAGYTDELIQQTIYMYQLKLSVLEMMQQEAAKINQRINTNSHEKKKIQLIY